MMAVTNRAIDDTKQRLSDHQDDGGRRSLMLASIMMGMVMLGLFLWGKAGLLAPPVQQSSLRQTPDEIKGLTSSTTEEESSNGAAEDINMETPCLQRMPSYKTNTPEGESVTNTVPCGMFLIDEKLLWCPNAKVGTTTTYMMLQDLGLFPRGQRCLQDCDERASILLDSHLATPKTKAQVLHAQSFTVVRNPWDRLRATYVGKILTGRIRPGVSADEAGYEDDESFRVMTFAEFVVHVASDPIGDYHWMPFSARCLTSPSAKGQVFHYDHIIKLEDGLFEGLERVFNAANVTFPKQQHTANIHTEHTANALVEFYRNASTPEMSMEELVEMVGDAYRDDIVAFGYSFPEYAEGKTNQG